MGEPTRYADYPDHPLRDVSQDVLDAARAVTLDAANVGDLEPEQSEPIADAVVAAVAGMLSTAAAPTPGLDLDAAKKLLADAGFVAVREASQRRAQEKLRTAEALAASEAEERQRTRQWAEEQLLPRERHLADQVAFLSALAVSKGATLDELGGHRLVADDPNLSTNLKALVQQAAVEGNWSPGDLIYRMYLMLDRATPVDAPIDEAI